MNYKNLKEIVSVPSVLSSIKEAPLKKFFMLKTTHNGISFLCLKLLELIDYSLESLQVRESFLTFPMCNLFFVESITILSAYILVIPHHNVDNKELFVRIRRPSAMKTNQFNDVKLLFQDKEINVFHSHEGGCLVSLNGLDTIITKNMVRFSAKREL
jgi:hypothetical protein